MASPVTLVRQNNVVLALKINTYSVTYDSKETFVNTDVLFTGQVCGVKASSKVLSEPDSILKVLSLSYANFLFGLWMRCDPSVT